MFAGIALIRNEEAIIQNTLDHVAEFVDAIYIYDDCSTDNTVAICEAHPKVKGIIKGTMWDPSPMGRRRAEGTLRQRVNQLAIRNGAKWIYYFDADEYIEFRASMFKHNAYYFRLFDFYITPEDINTPYLERKWMGPEYRDIPMVFKVHPQLRFTQRVPKHYFVNKYESRFGEVVFGGYVKHYGKAITVEEWEETCEYYTKHRWKGIQPTLQKRWEDRKGKAVHTVSDFGRPLIEWYERCDDSKIVAIT